MIKASFRLGGEIIEAIYSKDGLMFHDLSTGSITSIEGISLSKQGVTTEFPDLENDEEWRLKAIIRLKSHIKKMKSEDQVINYVIKELKKVGYEPLIKQRAGFRPQRIK